MVVSIYCPTCWVISLNHVAKCSSFRNRNRLTLVVCDVNTQYYNLFMCSSFPENALLPGGIQAFSSYPGSIFSGDDFYILSSGLVRTFCMLLFITTWVRLDGVSRSDLMLCLQVTLETTIGNSNPALWQFVQPIGTVFEWLRNIVANRLAATGKEWAQIFSKYNSGTWVFTHHKETGLCDFLIIPSSHCNLHEQALMCCLLLFVLRSMFPLLTSFEKIVCVLRLHRESRKEALTV